MVGSGNGTSDPFTVETFATNSTDTDGVLSATRETREGVMINVDADSEAGVVVPSTFAIGHLILIGIASKVDIDIGLGSRDRVDSRSRADNAGTTDDHVIDSDTLAIVVSHFESNLISAGGRRKIY
jgi:hypothetical protein